MIVEGEEGNFSAYFPDLPGCATAGTTMEELRSNAKEALLLYFEEQGDRDLPEASEPVALEFIEIDHSDVKAWAAPASAARPSRAG
jgi:predicted RNase H-like HicB family nuclease